MLKFQHIIKEDKIEFEKLPAFDKKVLNLIHQKVITPYEEHYGNSIDPIDNATELIEDIDLLKRIYDFLSDVMELGHVASQSFIDLLVSNFRPDGDYTDLNNAVYKPKDQKPYEKIFTEWAGITPYLVDDVADPGDVPIVYDVYEQQHYMIANQDQLESLVKDYHEDMGYGDSEIISALGEERYIELLYVSNADARMIAGEDASMAVEDISDRDLLERLGDMNSSLRNRYDSLENDIDDAFNADEDTSELESKKDNIIDQGREVVREEIYDDTYDKLINHLMDWLWELGYISKRSDTREFEFSSHLRSDSVFLGQGIVDLDKLPPWLQFDRETFLQNEIDDTMANESFEILSNSGDGAEEVTYEGDTYYIIDTDY